MAVEWTCGAECGVLPADTFTGGPHAMRLIQGTNSTLSFDTTTIRSGLRSYKLVCTPGGGAGDRAVLYDPPGSTTVCVARFYIYFESLPNAQACLAGAQSSSGSTQCNINFNSTTNKFNMSSIQNGLGTDIGPTVVTGQWYQIDFSADVSTNPHVFKARVDNGAETTLNFSRAAGSADNRFYIASLGQIGSATYTCYYDDIITGNAVTDYPFGQGLVVGFSPTRDGSHTATGTTTVKGTTGTPVGSAITSATTDAYQWLDDVPVDTVGDFWNGQSNASTTYAEVGFADTQGLGIPLAVEVVVALSAANVQANSQKATLYDGTTASDIYALSAVGANYPALIYQHKMYATTPTGGSWTTDTWSNLRFRWGYVADANPDPYCVNVLLEVALPGRVPYVSPYRQILR